MGLLVTELAVLVLFSAVALFKALTHTHGFVYPSLSWLTPTGFGGVEQPQQRDADRGLHLLGLGHRVERERGEREREHDARLCRRDLDVHPRRDLRGRGLRGAVRARRRLPLQQPRRRVPRHRQDRVRRRPALGTLCFKLLIIAILTSSAASCQTTILPAARTALSMAIHRAFPPKFGEVDAAAPHARVLDVVLRHRIERLLRRAHHRRPVLARRRAHVGRRRAWG